MKNLLILGGTGFVGRSVCEKLVERSGGGGGRITVPSRRPPRAKHLMPLPTVQLVEADVHDEAKLTRLLAGHDAVVNLVAMLHGSDAQFQRTHVDLSKTLMRACAQARVRRVIHISALGVDGAPPSRYLRSKSAGEAVVTASGLDWTVLRPSVIFGAHDRFLNLFATLLAVAPVMPLAGAGARFQPVWVQDVADAIVHCLDTPASAGRMFECVGPDVFTLTELVRLAGRWSGHERPVIALSDGLGRLQAGIMERLPGEPLMSRDNLDSMRTPNVASGRLPTLADLNIRAASLESVAPTYLGADRGIGRLEHWRAHGRGRPG